MSANTELKELLFDFDDLNFSKQYDEEINPFEEEGNPFDICAKNKSKTE